MPFHRWPKSRGAQVLGRPSTRNGHRPGQRHAREELIFSLSLSQISRIVLATGSLRGLSLELWNPGLHVPGTMESVTDPFSGWKGTDAPSASAKVTLTLGVGQRGAQKHGLARTTAHGAGVWRTE